MKIVTDITGRVETGPLIVNDDWPGIFVRGDDCVTLKEILDRVYVDSEDHNERQLAGILRRAIIEALSPGIKQIDNKVLT